jgi:hypothetical protein
MSFICPNINCNKEFKYISELKKHLTNSYHCGKSIENINLFILEKQKLINNEKIQCINCNLFYSKKSSLVRHMNNSNCSKIIIELNKQKQILILQKQLDELKLSMNNGQNNNLIIQPTIQPTNQQINNNNLTINNNNNNNITIIQHINPTGYETLPASMTLAESLRLLNLGDKGVIEIVKIVCEQEENKNFYKLNMNKNNISYLNNNYTIEICQDKELKDKLMKQCVLLTYKMLINCSSIMTPEQIYKINSNLQSISQKMKEEIYDNGLKNIIEYELRNNNKNTKNKIIKYTKEINTNPDIKQQSLNNYNNLLQIKEDTLKNKNPIISLFEINNTFGNPLTEPTLQKAIVFQDFNSKRLEYTTYYKYWVQRIEKEKKYIKSHPNKTIGDITIFEDRKNDIIKNIHKMKQINDNMRELDENNNFLITEHNFIVHFPDDYINENIRLQNQIILNNDAYSYDNDNDTYDNEQNLDNFIF